jgi:hypothetical protein
MAGFYILEGKIPVPCDHATWLNRLNPTILKEDDFSTHFVTTVFLSFRIGRTYQPLLFVTKILRNPAREAHGGLAEYSVSKAKPDFSARDVYTSTWELALEQHAARSPKFTTNGRGTAPISDSLR